MTPGSCVVALAPALPNLLVKHVRPVSRQSSVARSLVYNSLVYNRLVYNSCSLTTSPEVCMYVTTHMYIPSMYISTMAHPGLYTVCSLHDVTSYKHHLYFDTIFKKTTYVDCCTTVHLCTHAHRGLATPALRCHPLVSTWNFSFFAHVPNTAVDRKLKFTRTPPPPCTQIVLPELAPRSLSTATKRPRQAIVLPLHRAHGLEG